MKVNKTGLQPKKWNVSGGLQIHKSIGKNIQ
jgi:hypothetical protein